MINILEKKNCCGCNACMQHCPKHCIMMHGDEEGFLYPKFDASLCIDCGLCERVCPVLNQNEKIEPIAVYAVQHENKMIRMQSSSGGIFTLIGTEIIELGGVVFGARWDENMKLIHAYTDTIEGLIPFRGSKYVQSYIGETYKQAEAFLKQGRMVLFTGVACQIAGLKNFLRKEYDNLLTIDVLCHGVPSPRVFLDYLFYLGGKHKVVDFNFRDKITGWKGYSVAYSLDNGKHKMQRAQLDEFMRGYLNHYMLRPSCHSCPVKAGKSGSDLTLGDLWGCDKLHHIEDDDTGISAVIVNSTKGESMFNKCNVITTEVSIEMVKANNPAYYKSSSCSKERDNFWNNYNKEGFNAVIRLNDKLGPKIKDLRWLFFKVRIVNILKQLHFKK